MILTAFVLALCLIPVASLAGEAKGAAHAGYGRNAFHFYDNGYVFGEDGICKMCNGEGVIPCWACEDGNCWDCWECKGTAHTECPLCHGSGICSMDVCVDEKLN